MNLYYGELTNQYSVSKTLRNRLIPVGKTLDNIRLNHVLEKDQEKSDAYPMVKKMIDKYHLMIINEALDGVKLDNLEKAAELYRLGKKRDDQQEKELDECFAKLRKEIVAALKLHKQFSILDKAELVEKILPQVAESDEEKSALEKFEKFTTYFTNFNTVRMNLYSDEKKSSTVAYRLIEENLPRFFDNIIVYDVIRKKSVDMSDVQAMLDKYNIDNLDVLFIVDEFNYVLTQNGIDIYNAIIGDVNRIINLFNQHNKDITKIPRMKSLYKQILADREKAFYIDGFHSDGELLNAIKSFEGYISEFLQQNNKDGIAGMLQCLKNSSGYGIYIKNDVNLTSFSNICCDRWNVLSDIISRDYDDKYVGKKKKDTEKYDEEKKKALGRQKSISVGRLNELTGGENLLSAYIARIKEDVHSVIAKQADMDKVLGEYNDGKKLSNYNAGVIGIKAYLDGIKQLEADVKILSGTGMEGERDLIFYGEFTVAFDGLRQVDSLYNMTRNYLTQKPFSTEKMKLNFERTTLLSGWDKNKEKDNLGIILEKNGCYYLGIMNRNNNKIFDAMPQMSEGDCYRKMEYKLLPGPNKMLPKVFFSKSRIEEFAPSKELLDKYEKGTHKKGDSFSKEDCHNLIDFFKESIGKHEDWSQFGFHFSDTSTYDDISGFYREVQNQGYKLSFVDVASSYIDELVDSGALYLFQIYNKDFSKYSKGNYNLHTLYWKMLFDERNLKNVVYALNGGAEVFYRPASIMEEDKTVHKSGKPIDNKRHSEKKTSTFAYDIVKERRYTEDSFEFHVPITMNFSAPGVGNFNLKVNSVLRKYQDVHVIGIDRGERNLLYVVVVDSKGRIVEQISLNTIQTTYTGGNVDVDYHRLLDEREKQRDEARKSWKSIENIKELKEGYMSQVVHIIADLIIKYNAVIAIEDLNFGFMRGRQKVEKQVYQKFEKMLIEKLNYLVMDKSRSQEEPAKVGGALNALQLTDKFESFKKLGKQTGVIYYVPAWMTSKIDPTTGFVNLLDLKYENMDKSRQFFSKFDGITYNAEKDYFEFNFDYENFTYKAGKSRTRWTLCSYGKRIEKYRDINANNSWLDRDVSPTDKLKDLLGRYGITYDAGQNLIQNIVQIEDADFYKELYQCLRLVLQIRNSSNDGKRDYLQSCVMNDKGRFFNSEESDDSLPRDADANGAYNIARKGLWVLEQIRNSSEDNLAKVKLAISNQEWLCYAQENRSING